MDRTRKRTPRGEHADTRAPRPLPDGLTESAGPDRAGRAQGLGGGPGCGHTPRGF